MNNAPSTKKLSNRLSTKLSQSKLTNKRKFTTKPFKKQKKEQKKKSFSPTSINANLSISSLSSIISPSSTCPHQLLSSPSSPLSTLSFLPKALSNLLTTFSTSISSSTPSTTTSSSSSSIKSSFQSILLRKQYKKFPQLHLFSHPSLSPTLTNQLRSITTTSTSTSSSATSSSTTSKLTASTRRVGQYFSSTTSIRTQSNHKRKITLQHIPKRLFMNIVKEVTTSLIQFGRALATDIQNFMNPFHNKRGSTLGLGGSVPVQYMIRNGLIVLALGAAVLYGAIVLFRVVIFALKVAVVVYVVHRIKLILTSAHLSNGQFEKALKWDTWGESHKDTSLLAQILWNMNPISWYRRLNHFLSVDRRHHERCQEIAIEVVQKLQSDSRMPHIFPPDFIIGEFTRETIGQTIFDDEKPDLGGFITIPIYTATPTIIDLGATATKQGTGSDLPEEEIQQQKSNALLDEVHRILSRKYGSNVQDHPLPEVNELLQELQQREQDAIDPYEDENYPYKYYRPIPKWRLEQLDAESKENILKAKREAFHTNYNIEARTRLMDYSAIENRWDNLKWDIRKNHLKPSDWMIPTANPELTEIGTVYVFFTIPALDNVVQEKESDTDDSTKIRVDPFAFLSAGTTHPFELEKVFVVGDNVDRFTLYQRGVANWSTKKSLEKDRTIGTYRKQLQESKEAPPDPSYQTDEHGHTYQKSSTRVVDFDLKSNKPVVEAEFVEAETVSTNSNDQSSSSNSKNTGNIYEAEVVAKK